MVNEVPGNGIPGPLSDGERACARALDFVNCGQINDARDAIAHLDAAQRHAVRREYMLVAEAIELAWKINGGHYQQSVRRILQILGDLERSRFRTRLAWLHSAVGFALGVLGDPERGLEWTQRALAQSELEPKNSSTYILHSNHGSLLGMMDRFEESIASFHKTLEAGKAEPGQVENSRYMGYNNIAFCYLLWSEKTADRARKLEYAQHAVDYAKSAIASNPVTPRFRNGIAARATLCHALLILRLLNEAEVALDEAFRFEIAPSQELLSLMLARAIAERVKGQWDAANNWLDRAETLARDHKIDIGLQKIFEVRIRLNEVANRPQEALRQAKNYSEFLKVHYTQRLKAMARSAELYADAERSRWEAAELRTQTKLMGEKVAALDRQRGLGQMSATLGHEINQPLTAIQTAAQTLQRSFTIAGFDTQKQAKMAERIVFNSRRAANIISKIRSFIKPTEAVRTPVDLHSVVREVVELLSHDALRRGVEVQVVQANAPAWVLADPIQLSQVFVNLVRNAFDAMEGSRMRQLRIAVKADAAQFLVQFQDTGPGFSEAMLKEAGKPFFTSKPDGLGIGLSISHDILKLHNGTLKLGNADAGGALLEVSLPMLPQQE